MEKETKATEATEVEMYISNYWGDNYLIKDWRSEQVQDALEEFADKVFIRKLDVFEECTIDLINMANKYDEMEVKLAQQTASLSKELGDYKGLHEQGCSIIKVLQADEEKLKKELADKQMQIDNLKNSLREWMIDADKDYQHQEDKYQGLKAKADKMYEVIKKVRETNDCPVDRYYLDHGITEYESLNESK